MRLCPPALHQFATGVGQANTSAVLQHPTAIGRPLDAIPDRAVHLVGQRPPNGFALGSVVKASHQVSIEGLSRVGHEPILVPAARNGAFIASVVSGVPLQVQCGGQA